MDYNSYDAERTTFNGSLLAVVRVGTEEGKLQITVSADGCAEQTLMIPVIA